MRRLLLYLTITPLLFGCVSPAKVVEQLKAAENNNSNKTTLYLKVCPEMNGFN